MRTKDNAALFPLGAAVRADELAKDPYAVLKQLREREPISWIACLGVWYVTRYRDVLEVIGNTAVFSNQSRHSLIFDTFGEQMLSIEGAKHLRYKSGMRPPFLPRAVRQHLEPAIAPIVNELIDEFVAAGKAELRARFAGRLPVRMMLRVFGLPVKTEPLLRGWYDSFESALANFERDDKIRLLARRNVGHFKKLLQTHMDQARETSDDSLLSTLVNTNSADRLSDDEIKRNSLIVFFGGISTVEALILNTLWSLIEHPDVLEAVRNDKELIPLTIEETLRWRSPVQSATRHVTQAYEFRGVQFETGDTVNCMLASANRDSAVFDDPDEFRIDRANIKEHLAFATGLHFCLGFHLARTQARVAIDTLLRRLPELRLDKGAEATPTGYEFHQPEALPLRWRA